MANYAVEKYSTQGSYIDVLSALETKLETVDSAKTIRLIRVVPNGNSYIGVLIYDV